MGSNLPSSASWVRSLPKLSNTGVFDLSFFFSFALPDFPDPLISASPEATVEGLL